MVERIRQFVPYKAKKGEAYMSPRQLAHFRKLLTDWKADVVAELGDTHLMQDEHVHYPDANDRATQESDMAHDLRLRERERKLLLSIDTTLEFFDSGEYGYCRECGVEIGLARLNARPTATLCIDCKTLEELRERQHAA